MIELIQKLTLYATIVVLISVIICGIYLSIELLKMVYEQLHSTFWRLKNARNKRKILANRR